MSGKTDKRLHDRTQADPETMAARWAATFGKKAEQPADTVVRFDTVVQSQVWEMKDALDAVPDQP